MLNSENVRKSLFNVFWAQGSTSVEAETTVVQGIVQPFGFETVKLEAEKENVRQMLEELSDDFRATGGGGMSTLNMCMDKGGRQWGEQRDVEALCALAIAMDLGVWALPREVWDVLPGGMPYFVYKDA